MSPEARKADRRFSRVWWVRIRVRVALLERVEGGLVSIGGRP